MESKDVIFRQSSSYFCVVFLNKFDWVIVIHFQVLLFFRRPAAIPLTCTFRTILRVSSETWASVLHRLLRRPWPILMVTIKEQTISPLWLMETPSPGRKWWIQRLLLGPQAPRRQRTLTPTRVSKWTGNNRLRHHTTTTTSQVIRIACLPCTTTQLLSTLKIKCLPQQCKINNRINSPRTSTSFKVPRSQEIMSRINSNNLIHKWCPAACSPRPMRNQVRLLEATATCRINSSHCGLIRTGKLSIQFMQKTLNWIFSTFYFTNFCIKQGFGVTVDYLIIYIFEILANRLLAELPNVFHCVYDL